MLDLVPFAGAGRQVGHGDGEAGLVGEALDLALPQADPNAIAAAAIFGGSIFFSTAALRSSGYATSSSYSAHLEN